MEKGTGQIERRPVCPPRSHSTTRSLPMSTRPTAQAGELSAGSSDWEASRGVVLFRPTVGAMRSGGRASFLSAPYWAFMRSSRVCLGTQLLNRIGGLGGGQRGGWGTVLPALSKPKMRA